MKAMICTAYGSPSVLQLKTLDKPLPRPNEVLIKIHVANVNSSDIELRSGNWYWLFWLPARLMYGITKPRHLIPGYELAGTVEQVGDKVTRFKTGDVVYGAASWRGGCSAEYICLSENASLAVKPESMPIEEAAAFCDSACTAWNFLQKSGLKSGHKLLVYGASGSVGTMAVQLGKYLGAEVIGVCSKSNQNLVMSLGANKVINYQVEDFSNHGQIYDVIFDAIGKADLSRVIKALKPGGVFATTRMKLGYRISAIGSDKRLVGGLSISNSETLTFLTSLYLAGQLRVAIDRYYNLEDLALAHQYVESGRKRGNVVLRVSNCDEYQALT